MCTCYPGRRTAYGKPVYLNTLVMLYAAGQDIPGARITSPAEKMLYVPEIPDHMPEHRK